MSHAPVKDPKERSLCRPWIKARRLSAPKAESIHHQAPRTTPPGAPVQFPRNQYKYDSEASWLAIPNFMTFEEPGTSYVSHRGIRIWLIAL